MLKFDDSTRNSTLKPPYFYTKPYPSALANIIRAFMSSLLSLDDCAFHAYSVTAGSATFLNFNVILGPTDSLWKPGER